MKASSKIQNKKFLIAFLSILIFFVLLLVGFVVPIARADPGVCNPNITRYSLLKGEYKAFQDVKQKEIDRKNTIKKSSDATGCSAGTRADLYIF